ncbi:hypothetical protein CK203_041543 [Vitis vinifera]|uniref:Uncharacterized protein n=1 Tax=Vitis vinifera TaxID=29760 RepID=A0A438I7K8_VITVI|nr:hypothetical protein CK203_041543 [Vitis vinifera]
MCDEQLQLRLQQEKSMRTMLERAMGRASSTLSPGHRHFAAEFQPETEKGYKKKKWKSNSLEQTWEQRS